MNDNTDTVQPKKAGRPPAPKILIATTNHNGFDQTVVRDTRAGLDYPFFRAATAAIVAGKLLRGEPAGPLNGRPSNLDTFGVRADEWVEVAA